MLIVTPGWPFYIAIVSPRFAKSDLGLANWRMGFWFIRKPWQRYDGTSVSPRS